MKIAYFLLGAILLLMLFNVFTGKEQKLPIGLQGDTIKITDNGFMPEVLYVKTGTIVHFTNETKEWRWPASDLHPTHLLYPELDPKKPIGPGSTWDFTITKKGTWGIHDHLTPYFRAKIIVIE